MLTSICQVMEEAYKRNWISTRDGNISLRQSMCGELSKYIYITPSGVRKNVLRQEDLIKLDTSVSTVTGNPSIELDLHLNLQASAKKTQAVVHLHPTYTIAAMHAGYELKDIAILFPELSRYTKVGPNVPYFPPGSDDLANGTDDAFRIDGQIAYDIVGLDKHGVVAIASNVWDAFEHIERLEHICKIKLASR